MYRFNGSGIFLIVIVCFLFLSTTVYTLIKNLNYLCVDCVELTTYTHIRDVQMDSLCECLFPCATCRIYCHPTHPLIHTCIHTYIHNSIICTHDVSPFVSKICALLLCTNDYTPTKQITILCFFYIIYRTCFARFILLL